MKKRKYKSKRTPRFRLAKQFGMSRTELRRFLLRHDIQKKISSACKKVFDIALPGERGGYRSFIAFKVKPSSYFDPRSFRFSPKKVDPQRTRFLYGCPRGKWKKGRCQTSTTVHKVLIPMKRVMSVLMAYRPIKKIAANPVILETNRKRNPLLMTVTNVKYPKLKFRGKPLMPTYNRTRRSNPLLMTVTNKSQTRCFRCGRLIIGKSYGKTIRQVDRLVTAYCKKCWERSTKRGTKRNPLLMTVMNPGVPTRNLRNPLMVVCPFAFDKAVPRQQFENWLFNTGDAGKIQMYKTEMKKYQRFHHGSLPVTITREPLNIGMSKAITDTAFSFSTGKSAGELYSVPAHSNKKKHGKHYIHEYDKGNEPEGVVHGVPGSQVVTKRLKGSAKVTDWYHH